MIVGVELDGFSVVQISVAVEILGVVVIEVVDFVAVVDGTSDEVDAAVV